MPKVIATQITFMAGKRRGWGSVRVTATIGNTSWKTSVFPIKKDATYLLPVKSSVRKAEALLLGKPAIIAPTMECAL